MGLFGKKPPPPVDVPPPITLGAKGGETQQDDQKNLLTAKQSPGFLVAQRLLAHAMDNRAQSVVLDYTTQGVAVRYIIDGFPHAAPPLDRMNGDVMLAVFKTICNLNMNERRAKQKGSFTADYRKRKFKCKFTSQGTQTGERVLLELGETKFKVERLADTGMRPQMVDAFKEILNGPAGIVLISAPPGHGFSTTFNASLFSADRYIRNFAEVIEAENPDDAVENCPQTKFNAANGETPMTVLPKLLRTYPDVVVMRDFHDAETLALMCDQVTEESRLVIGGLQAKDSIEALQRIVSMGVPPKKIAPNIKSVLNMRLLRQLCEDCKVPYAPQPQILQQLGIPPGRVQAFFRPHEGPLPLPPDAPKDAVPMPCPKCLGVGYRGRMSIYELLVLNDRVRQVLATNPAADVLRQESRQAGFLSLQEEGIALVAKGSTSLPELLRVLKE